MAGACLALCVACGGEELALPPVVDAGPDTLFVSRPADADVRADAGGDRVTAHDGVVVASPSVLVLYLGKPGVDAATPQDGFVDWMLQSSYWAMLEQYGVFAGKRVTSLEVARDELVPAIDQDAEGLVWIDGLAARLHAWVDKNGMMGANTLLVFLPDGVNVKLSVRGNYTYQTCIDAFGYHAYDGREPYAVMPACPKGRETASIAHELAELATDPQSNRGWFSNGDLPKGGGEIGDLCLGQQASSEGWVVAQLWSNLGKSCKP